MRAFVSFTRFFLDGGPARIVLGLCGAKPALALKQTLLESLAANAFETRLRDLAAENWSGRKAAFARAYIEAGPITEGIETEFVRQISFTTYSAGCLLQ